MNRTVPAFLTSKKITRQFVVIAALLLFGMAKADAQWPGLCGQNWYYCGGGTQLYTCTGPSAPNTGDYYDGYYIEWRVNGNLVSSNSYYYATQPGNYEVRYVYKFHYFTNFFNSRRDYTQWYSSSTYVYEYQPDAPGVNAYQNPVCTGTGTTLYSNYGNTIWKDQNGTQVGSGTYFTTPALTAPATYYAYQVNGSCSSNPTGYTVNIAPQPDATISASSTTICQGGSAVLSAQSGNVSYIWYRDGVQVASGNSNTYTATQAGSYSLRVYNSYNCFSSSPSNVVITVNALPTINIAASGPTSICENGNLTLTASTPGNALSFDGSYFTQSTNPALPLGNNSRTIEALIKTTQTTTGVIMNWGQISTNQRFGMLVVSGRLYFVGENNDLVGNIVINDGNWHHVAVTFDGATVRLYVDGVADVFANKTLNTTNSTLRIGERSIGDLGHELFVGTIDEVRVWNFTKTPAQINNDMWRQVPANSTGLVAQYSLNETSGSTTTDATTNNITATIRNLSGTAVNGIWSPNASPLTYPSFVWSPGGSSAKSLAPTASGNYTVTVTDINGCSGTSTPTSVTINSLPVVAAIQGVNKLCVAGSTQLTNTTAGGTWSSSNNAIATVDNNGKVTGASVGTANISYAVSTNGCTSSVTTGIVVNVAPVAAINAGGPLTFCEGGNVTLKSSGSSLGNALAFNGTTGYVNVNSTSTINNLGLSGYTLEAWVYPSDVSGVKSILRKTGDYNLYIINGSIAAEVWPMGAGNTTWIKLEPSAANVLANNTWAHIAATWNKQTGAFKLYINGTQINTVVTNGSIGGSEPLLIGKSSIYGQPFIGKLDEVRIWNKERSATEVADNRNMFIPSTTPNLVAYYKFDEANGTTTSDATGNGNTGTLISGTTRVIPSDVPVTYSNYTWSNNATSESITVTQSGAYTLTVRDANGCSTTSAPTTVTVKAQPVAPTISGNIPVCSGGNLTIVAQHPDPTAVFSWCNNVTSGNTFNMTNVTQPITYCVRATVNGCTSSQLSFAPTVLALPTFTATKIDASCVNANDGKITISSSNANAYSIDNGATFVASNTFTGLAAGSYNVVVKSAAGCNSAVQSITIATTPDVTKPVRTVATLPVITGQCSASVTTIPTAIDNCSGVINATTTSQLVYTSQGTYTITWNYKDAAGNIETQTQTVIVKDDTKPVITTPDPVVVTLTSGCNTNVTVPAITVTDNCQNPPGSALNFDGVNDQVAVANGLPSMNEVTIETWLNPKRINNWDVIMNYNSFSTGDIHFQFVPDGRLEFSIAGNNPTDQFTSATFSSNQWYHFAAVYSASGKYVKFYLNGNLIDTRNYTTAINTSNGVPFTIGNWANQRPFEGDLDDLRIWNVAKTDAQIKADMNKTLIGSETGLMAYYNFNQGVACANNSSNQTLTDLKGLRNGTLQNFDLSAASCNSNWTNGAPTTGISVTNDRTNTSDASGVYPVGNTHITWTATDAAGNVSTATQLITVLAPEANVTGNAIAIADGTTTVSAADNTDMGPTFPGIAITKNFTIENKGTAPLTVSSINIAGSASFSLNGITLPVTIAANDNATFNVQFLSNTVGIANATITVNNNDCDEAAYNFAVKAEINCTIPAFNNINVYLQQSTSANSCDAAVTYPLAVTGIPAPNITYTFSGATVRTGNGTGSGEIFNKGLTHVVVSAINACGTRTAAFDVTVVDDVKPIAKAKNITVALNASGAATVTPSMINDGSTDNCGAVTLSMTGSGTLCGIAGENGSITITAPAGALIDRVDFASYGTGTGDCGSFVLGGCHATNSKTIIEQLALGKNSFTVGANNGVFGDPCNGTVKNLRIQVHYKVANATTSTFSCSDVGNNNVTLTVTDANGNVSTATAVVTVVDNIAPVVRTQPITLALNAAGVATVTAAQVNNGSTDNCTIQSYTLDKTTFTCSDRGANTVTLTVTDVNGNSSTGTAVVTIVDNTLPSIATPATVNTTTNAGECRATINLTAPAVSDNCGVASLVNNAPDFFPVGTTTVKWTVTDNSGLTRSVNQTVIVRDVELPVITQPASINVNNDRSICGATVSISDPASTDNCGIASTSGVRNDGRSLSAIYPVGTTTITWTVKDIHNNVSTATQTIVVTDNENPVITQQAAINVNNDRGVCGAAVTITQPVSTDNCAVATTTGVRSDALALTAIYPVGTTTITWTVTDIHGNSSSSTQTITVADNENPVIIQPAAISVNNDRGVCGATVSITEPASTDNCGVATTTGVRSDALALTAIYPVGTTTITWTVTDIHGNSSTSIQTIIVTDNEAPIITQPAAINVNNDLGRCGAKVILENPAATENCDVASITANKPFNNNYPVGSTTVTWTVTDIHGNTSTATQLVVVADNENPIITQPAAISVNNDNGICGANVAITKPVATDNCAVATTTGVRSDERSLNAIYPVGTTTITWTVTDIHGNSSTATQTITVADNEKPIITQPATISVNNDRGVCGATVSITEPVATDNCGVATTTGVRSDALALTAIYPVGTTTITWTVTDIHANVSTITQTIIVTDNEKPVVTQPAVVNRTNDAGRCGAKIELADPVATDNCGIASIISNKPFNSNYPVGSTTVTWTITDIHNNTTTVYQTVNVTDTEKPVVITKTATITLVNGQATITAADVNNASTDNCGIASIVVSKTTFNCTNTGANTVTLTITDNHGNVNTNTATVMVIGEVPTSNITSVPTNTTYTGGVSTNLYLGYGAQSTTLQVNVPASGAPYTYEWSGTAIGKLSSATSGAPVFTPTVAGSYTFNVVAKNKYGCTTTSSITICVKDIRVPGTDGKKVYVCHVPEGNRNNPNTLEISVNAVATHIGMHSFDKLGTCDQVCGTAAGALTRVVEPVKQITSTTTITPTPTLTTDALSVKVDEKGVPGTFNVLKATVRPNPTTTTFVVRASSSSKENVTIRIIDEMGRVHEMKNTAANTDVIMGAALKAGAYFIEVRQGNNKQVVKGIKLN